MLNFNASQVSRDTGLSVYKLRGFKKGTSDLKLKDAYILANYLKLTLEQLYSLHYHKTAGSLVVYMSVREARRKYTGIKLSEVRHFIVQDTPLQGTDDVYLAVMPLQVSKKKEVK